MYTIDLNCDLGESFGTYKIGMDEEIIPLISSSNIACGFHAGDPNVMAKTIRMCKENNVAVGAHPGFYDLQGFGRRNISISPSDAKNIITYQMGALDAFCKQQGIIMQHVKPHGALYNMAAKDYLLAKAICEGIFEYNKSLILLGLAGSEMLKAAQDTGLIYASEFFADRAYEDDGTLVPRTNPRALIRDEDELINRIISTIKNHTVKSINGKEIKIAPHSLCVHGDGEKALLFVKRIKQTFENEHICIKPISEVLYNSVGSSANFV